ncbi:MAG: hypothetical protein PHW24_05040 [Candidatus Moranbacteria bacterium]|nr:hypothetical protein [Candidatus Moranbacteria bacterium]
MKKMFFAIVVALLSLSAAVFAGQQCPQGASCDGTYILSGSMTGLAPGKLTMEEPKKVLVSSYFSASSKPDYYEAINAAYDDAVEFITELETKGQKNILSISHSAQCVKKNCSAQVVILHYPEKK